MSLSDRVNALSYIPKYLDHVRWTGHDQAYPTTYLNQRYIDSLSVGKVELILDFQL